MLTPVVYGTTWVGETYYRQNEEHARELEGAKDIVGDIARKGSLALVMFSLISFSGSLFLPLLVRSSRDDSQHHARNPHLASRSRTTILTAWALSQMAFSGAMILTPLSRSFGFATSLVALCGM